MATSPQVFDVSIDDFDRRVRARSHELPVMVDFWAAWCGPCRALAPVLESVTASFAGKLELAKVDTEAEQALAGQYGIRSLPTVKLFRHGDVVDEFLGAQPETAIRAWLEPYVERESDRARQLAAELAAGGQPGAAIDLLRQALEADAGNLRVHADLAALLLDGGDAPGALAVLNSLPAAAAGEPVFETLRARARLAGQPGDGNDETALRDAVARAPDDCDARFALGARLAATGDYEAALEQMLAVIQRDRAFRDGAARQAMVDIFATLGNAGPLVSRYRQRLASSLN